MRFNIRNEKLKINSILFAVFLFPLAALAPAQIETPPPPSAASAINIPQVGSSQLPNGLRIVSVERRTVPLVTVSLLIKSGADSEADAQAGLADMTASLLLKGTKKRTATRIAEEIEFLGGNVNSGAGWNSSNVTLNITSDKLEQALEIMSDTILNPTFLPAEIRLYKTQAIDNLNVNLKQPSSIAGFVASRYSFGEHSATGTPESLAKINRMNIAAFYRKVFSPNNAVLIFAGDISRARALTLAQKYFSKWKNPAVKKNTAVGNINVSDTGKPPRGEVFKRLLVIDLPNSGQAAVTYAKKLGNGRTVPGAAGNAKSSEIYYPSLVANSVLGGGYSARLNQEIRIKRGLSYGALSGLSWRGYSSNVVARAQTKNVSAAQVAELIAAELKRLASEPVSQNELVPRKAVLTGTFGRSLETTNGLAAQIAELYTFGLSADQLNAFTQNVRAVSDAQIKNFAADLTGGDIIIVGDAKMFMDDLKKRFPNRKIEVIPAAELDLNRAGLRKSPRATVKTKRKTGR